MARNAVGELLPTAELVPQKNGVITRCAPDQRQAQSVGSARGNGAPGGITSEEEQLMKADAATQAAVTTMLNQLADGYAGRDWERLRTIFAPDSDVVMFGTQADEKRVGLDEIKLQAERDWSQSQATSLVWGWTSISAAGNVAWAAADATFEVKVEGQQLSLPARVTLVLEQRAGQWLIVQSHFSLPAAYEEGESFPA